jgi:hypothetical protein
MYMTNTIQDTRLHAHFRDLVTYNTCQLGVDTGVTGDAPIAATFYTGNVDIRAWISKAFSDGKNRTNDRGQEVVEATGHASCDDNLDPRGTWIHWHLHRNRKYNDKFQKIKH